MSEALTGEKSYHTQQGELLREKKVCTPAVAELLGLSFADRDLEVIDRLRDMNDLPQVSDFPETKAVAEALAIEPRWASFTLEKVQRFVHKRRMNGDYSIDIAHFSNRPDVRLLKDKLRGLKPGTTVFIGDSIMDNRHFSANASFAVLVGGLLESLGVGPYVNAGIGGQAAAQGLARFEQDVLAHRPARVVFSFSANDVSNGVPIEKMLGQFEQMIDAAKEVGAEVVLGLALHVVHDRLWWAKSEFRNADRESRRQVQAALEGLARQKGVKCMNVLERLTPEHYCVDGIHLNQAGQELCGVEVLEKLAG